MDILVNLPPNPDDEEPPNAEVVAPNAGELDAPKAGFEDAPKAGIELPNAGDEEAPKVVLEENGEEVWGAPNIPVAVPPNIELPVCEPKGVVLPKGLGAKGFVLVLFV